MTEEQIQSEQRNRYEAFLKNEGAIEVAVRDTTYQEPCQIVRTKWLVDQVQDLPFSNSTGRGMCRSILELGCSNGHQLLAMQGMAGVDLNPNLIKENQQAHPEILWIAADITNPTWDYMFVPFDCVTLPDIIEHLPWHHVTSVIRKAKHLAKRRVLITTPNGTDYHKNQRNWTVKKHQFVVTESKLKEILRVCREGDWNLTHREDEAFEYIRLDRGVFG